MIRLFSKRHDVWNADDGNQSIQNQSRGGAMWFACIFQNIRLPDADFLL